MFTTRRLSRGQRAVTAGRRLLGALFVAALASCDRTTGPLTASSDQTVVYTLRYCSIVAYGPRPSECAYGGSAYSYWPSGRFELHPDGSAIRVLATGFIEQLGGSGGTPTLGVDSVFGHWSETGDTVHVAWDNRPRYPSEALRLGADTLLDPSIHEYMYFWFVRDDATTRRRAVAPV